MIRPPDIINQEGRRKGFQEGEIRQAQEGILDNLEARFEVVPEFGGRVVRGIEELGVLKALRSSSVKVGTLANSKIT